MRRTRKYRFACSLARHLGLTLRGRDAEHAVLYSNLERRGYTWDPKMAKAGGWFREAERDPPARASRSSPACSPPPSQTLPARATAEAPQLHPCATCQSMPLLVRGFCPVCPQCRTKVCRDCGKALPNGRIYIVCRGCQRRKKPRVPAPTPASSAASTTPDTVEQDFRARVAVLEGQVARFELELASLRLTLSGKHLGDDPGELGPLFKIDMEGAPRGE